jgi:hypothetical protein
MGSIINWVKLTIRMPKQRRTTKLKALIFCMVLRGGRWSTASVYSGLTEGLGGLEDMLDMPDTDMTGTLSSPRGGRVRCVQQSE